MLFQLLLQKVIPSTRLKFLSTVFNFQNLVYHQKAFLSELFSIFFPSNHAKTTFQFLLEQLIIFCKTNPLWVWLKLHCKIILNPKTKSNNRNPKSSVSKMKSHLKNLTNFHFQLSQFNQKHQIHPTVQFHYLISISEKNPHIKIRNIL